MLRWQRKVSIPEHKGDESMKLSTKWLAERFSEYQGAGHENISIEDVCVDATLSMNKGLFVPLGPDQDHDALVKEAISNGAVAAFWVEGKHVPAFIPTDFPMYFVSDTHEALKQLIQAYLRDINVKVICVIGDEEAGVMRQQLGSFLDTQYKVYYTNPKMTTIEDVASSILQIPSQADYWIMDIKLGAIGELQSLSESVQPDIGIISSISSSPEVLQKSVEIFSGLKENGNVIINGDSPLLFELHELDPVWTCGFHERCDHVMVVQGESNHQIRILINREEYTVPKTDKQWILYAGMAIIVGKEAGIKPTLIQNGLDAFSKLYSSPIS